MIRRVKAALHSAFRSLGIDVIKYNAANSLELGLPKMLRKREISLVLDVGANMGQYVRRLRKNGYAGKVVSFEPLAEAFGSLATYAAKDPLWECRQVALGNVDGTGVISVSRNLVSSSLLPLSKLSTDACKDSAYVRSEEVALARMDSLWPEVVAEHDRVFLKLDVQGSEMAVLEGVDASLPGIVGVQVELSLVPLYQGQPLLPQVLNYLCSAGFALVSIDRGFADRRTGEVLQADGVFFRRSAG